MGKKNVLRNKKATTAVASEGTEVIIADEGRVIDPQTADAVLQGTIETHLGPAPNGGTSVQKKRYTKAEIQPFKERILREKLENDQAIEFEEQLARGEDRDAGEQSGDDPFNRTKSGQGTLSSGQTMRVFTDKRTLIESALRRIAAGTYGIDADTQELIPLVRLMANPYTTKATKPDMQVRKTVVGQTSGAQAEMSA